MDHERKMLIVGAGCFGISTAYHLLKRGYKDVTVIDRSNVLPAPDAASTDLNKVVRSSYSDGFYSRLALEAIELWKTEEWGNTYRESGVLVLGTSDTYEDSYANKSYINDVELGARVEKLITGEEIREKFPSDINVASFDGSSGYLNRDGGWAHAAQGIRLMMDSVVSLGGKVLPGKSVAKLLQENGRTIGVECADSTVFNADLVVLAAGSWTASSFPKLDFGGKCIATGQSLATIQLTPEEAKGYRQCPVVLNFGTNFYIFPPNGDNIVKLAIHDSGFTHFPSPELAISTPRTVSSDAQDGLRIPKIKVQELRQNLRKVYPDLAGKAFASTRLCWYTDSPDDDWVIGYYPSDASLVMATGGSGHAYKFLPVIGRVVSDAIEGTLDQQLVHKFAVSRDCTQMATSRWSGAFAVGKLDIPGLCISDDLLPE